MNRTVKGAKQVHGKDPQLLIEKIVRERIFESRYWKENCFGLDAERLLELAAGLDHVGGTYANQKPTPFLCLMLRMLQLQPDEDVVREFMDQEDFKYLRVLGLFYFRLVTHPASKVYLTLEPFLRDHRKLRVRQRNGSYALTFVDEVVDELLREDRVFDVILPRISSRMILEETEDLEPREPLVSVSDMDMNLEEDLEAVQDETNNHEDGGEEATPQLEMSIQATNALRAQLGLKPLQP